MHVLGKDVIAAGILEVWCQGAPLRRTCCGDQRIRGPDIEKAAEVIGGLLA